MLVLFLISVIEVFPICARNTLSYCLLLLGVLLLYIGRPRLIGQKELLIQKVCMFWDKRGAGDCEVPMQALTIGHSFGLIPQCFSTDKKVVIGARRRWNL